MPDENQGTPEIQTAKTTAAETHLPAMREDTGAAVTTQPPHSTPGVLPDVDAMDAGAYNEMRKMLLGFDVNETTGEPSHQNEPAEPAPAPPAAVAAEPAVAEPPAPVEEETPSKEFRPRLSVLDERSKEAITLARTMAEAQTPITLAEAERRVALKYGEEPGAAKTEPPPPATVRTPAAVDAEIEAARAERRAAAQEYDQVKQNEITERIEALLAERSQVEVQEKQAQVQEVRTLRETQLAMQTKYAALKDPESPASKSFEAIYARLEASGHPLMSESPAEQCRKISEMAAAEHGLAPNAPAAPKAPASVAPASAAERPIQPGNGSLRSVTPATTAGALEAALDGVKSSDQYDALMAKVAAGGFSS